LGSISSTFREAAAIGHHLPVDCLLWAVDTAVGVDKSGRLLARSALPVEPLIAEVDSRVVAFLGEDEVAVAIRLTGGEVDPPIRPAQVGLHPLVALAVVEAVERYLRPLQTLAGCARAHRHLESRVEVAGQQNEVGDDEVDRRLPVDRLTEVTSRRSHHDIEARLLHRRCHIGPMKPVIGGCRQLDAPLGIRQPAVDDLGYLPVTRKGVVVLARLDLLDQVEGVGPKM
jgi:hypothetical protein